MKRIPSLDGLRAIAILLVVWGHWAEVSFHSPIAGAYASLGRRIFFVLSGFLITTLLMKEHGKSSTIQLQRFYVRRAYRILPAAIVFMATVFVIFWHELRWYHMAAAVLYVVNFDFAHPWCLGHLWSISVQEQFYFVWPSVLKKWYPASSGDSGGGDRGCAGVSGGVPFCRPAWPRGRDVSGGGRYSGDRLPAGDFRGTFAADQGGLGAVDDGAGCAGSGLYGRDAIPDDSPAVASAVAGVAPFDRRTAPACDAKAVLDSECAACGLAGADQLWSLPMAAVVRIRGTSAAVVLSSFRAGAGNRFLLPAGTAGVAAAGKGNCVAEDRRCNGGCGLNEKENDEAGRLTARRSLRWERWEDGSGCREHGWS